MFDNLFTVENLLNVLGTFAYLFGELFLLFIAISFFVALLQVWVSKDRIKRILSRPHKVTNAVLGAALGAVTPFCSCSTIPVLVGLFKSGAPFSGAISFLMTSPILNPAIIALLLVFFGPVPTLVYTVITFTFAVCVGLLLDALGFSRYIKNVAVKGGCCGGDEVTWENLKGTFWQKPGSGMQVRLQGRHRAVQGGRRVAAPRRGHRSLHLRICSHRASGRACRGGQPLGHPACRRDRHPHVHPRGDDDPHRGDPHGEGRVSGRRHRAHPGRRGLFHPRGVAFEQHIQEAHGGDVRAVHPAGGHRHRLRVHTRHALAA